MPISFSLSKRKAFIWSVATVLYLPTVEGVNFRSIFLVIPLLISPLVFCPLNKVLKAKDLIFFLTLALITLNFTFSAFFSAIFVTQFEIVKNLLMPLVMLTTFLVGKVLAHEDERRYLFPILQTFVFLILFEVVITIVLHYVGGNWGRQLLAVTATSMPSDLLYYSRLEGLSSGAGTFGIKLFFGILLTGYLFSNGAISRRRTFCQFLLISFGLLLSFNRTAMLAAMFFFLIFAISQCAAKAPKAAILAAPFFGVLLGVIFLSLNFFTMDQQPRKTIINQFFRRRDVGTLEEGFRAMTRIPLWQEAVARISENPLLGNGSFKAYSEFRTSYLGMRDHYHNSFLQFSVTNGLIIGTVYFLFLSTYINVNNWPFIISIFFVSSGQYVIFWGLSTWDIIFYTLLFHGGRRNRLRFFGHNFRGGLIPSERLEFFKSKKHLLHSPTALK